MIKKMYISLHAKCRYSCQILTKLEFSQQIFEKYSNIKCHENLSSGSRVVPRGHKDRRDKATSYFSQFSETRLKIAQNSPLFTLSSITRCTHIYHLIYFFISRYLGAHTAIIPSSASIVMSHHFQI
jgi:hypothetical protein